MAVTKSDKILWRYDESRANEEFKRYMYNMRRFVAGDETNVGGDRTSVSEHVSVSGRVAKHNRLFPDFKITEHEEGVSNHTLTWVQNIIKQSIVSKPTIDSIGLKPSVSQFREEYLRDRLRLGNWKFHQHRALYSYLIDGIAFVIITMRDGCPKLKYVDTIDCYWDLHAETPYDMRYFARELRLSEDEARFEFGNAKTDWMLGNNKGTDDETKAGERIVKVVEYVDETTRAYIREMGGNNYELVKSEENPVGFMNLSVLSQPVLPSMMTPLPHIVTIIGAQTAHATLQRSLLEFNKKLKPFYQVTQAAFTIESYAEWEETGDISVLVNRQGLTFDEAKAAIQIRYVDKLPGEALTLKQDLEQEIVRGIGANPYTGGAPLDPKFSSEVAQISSQTQLGVAFVQDALGEFLADAFRKMLRIGADFDDKPFTIVDHGEPVTFGDGFPIKRMLLDDVQLEVRPGEFESEQMKLLKAIQFLQQALDPTIDARFPNILPRAIERWLVANGERDVTGAMAPPTPEEMMMQAMQQGGLPGMEGATEGNEENANQIPA